MRHHVIKRLVPCLLAFLLLATPLFLGAAEKKLVVGSKEFTEQRLLGQLMIALLEKNGFTTDDDTGLGGTLVARNALENRQIDIYMEYTGTALVTFLKHKEVITDPQKCFVVVKEEDLAKNKMTWLPYMPFDNTYCLVMKKSAAEKLGIQTLSDLSAYVNAKPDEISFGLNAEFYARPDGYKALQKAYDFKFGRKRIVKMSSGLIYKAVQDDQIDVGLAFATDGRIKGFDLVVLDDDKHYFPVYNPAPVLRTETAEKYPELTDIFAGLREKLDTAAMTNLNYQVDIEHKNVKEAAVDWLKTEGLL
ncbi:MAG: glycine betaine ABC transporter substrate-binding protein [Desulfopila sp.]